MQLNVPPDLETLINKRLSSGGYQSVEDVLRRALEAQDAEESWTDEDAADRVEQAIFDACEFLAAAPLRGHSRSDLTTRSLRFWTLTRYPNYSLVYRPETTPLQIVAVLHGKRNAQRILKQRT